MKDRDTDDELPEPWRSVLWRQQELERAGYPVLDAMSLAENPNVDIHRAAELLEEGCEPELAVQILS